MSNTDTELSNLVDEIVSLIDNDGPSTKTERAIRCLIQARDTAHKATLLKAVGELEATCETCDGKGVMEQQSAGSEWQETETWPCEEPIHQTRQALESIYRGTHE